MSKAIFFILSILLIAGIFLEEAEADSHSYYGGGRGHGGDRRGYDRRGYDRGEHGGGRGGDSHDGHDGGHDGHDGGHDGDGRGRRAVENDDAPLTFIGTPVDGFE